MPFPLTPHRNNISILSWEKHDIFLKILHQAGFETARQAATLVNMVKRHALTIAPCPFHKSVKLRLKLAGGLLLLQKNHKQT